MPFVNLSRILNSFSFIAIIVFASALLTSVAFPPDVGHGKSVRDEILVKPYAGPDKGSIKK